MRKATLAGSIDLAASTETGTVKEISASAVEIGITTNSLLGVEPGQNLEKERSSLGDIVDAEFRDPYLLDSMLLGESDCARDVILEVVRIGSVPVNSHHTGLAITAGFKER